MRYRSISKKLALRIDFERVCQTKEVHANGVGLLFDYENAELAKKRGSI